MEAIDRGQLRAMVAVAVLAGLLALGPLVGAVVNSVEIEVAIGQAAHLPVPEFLPAALDPVAGIALLVLAALRPARALRTWCWFLVFAVLVAAMAAGGAHAVFPTDAHGLLVLPPLIAFAVSTVPAASAAAVLHLLLLVIARALDLRRLLRTLPAQAAHDEEEDPPPAQECADAAHPAVRAALEAGRGYRWVMTEARWTRSRAEAALSAARGAERGAT